MNRGAYSRGYISQGASDGHLSLLEHLGPVHDRPSVGCHRDHAAGPECNEIALVHTGGETACSRHCGEHERLRVPVLRGRSARVLEWVKRGDGAQGRSAASGRITGRHGACLIAGRCAEGGISASRSRRTAWIWVGQAISGGACCSKKLLDTLFDMLLRRITTN